MQRTSTAQTLIREWQCERCGTKAPRAEGDETRRNCPVCGSKMVPIVESGEETKQLERLED
ncbi:MAG: hypothetical protein SPF89_03620 [Sphaerochaetaceae bacterium]|nr:hypothetical protein [Spirochaetales bacterium]MDY5499173.1 hypothetical protein [Sphaerochaetaceae bacterium]